MYGTVMIGTLAEGVTAHDCDMVSKEWLTQHVGGFVDENLLVDDEGSTFVAVVRFRDKEAFLRVAESSQQDAFYRERMAPLLDGEPRWIDGTWVAHYSGY